MGNGNRGNMLIFFLIVVVFSCPAAVMAQPDIASLLPEGEVVSGWQMLEEPQRYRGEELFLMIDGGADIYHEYGFSQVLTADYENEDGALIRLEVYEMDSPEGAYGIYSFKSGADGEALDIGQGAMLEEYYLNFWKGKLLVTIIGSDSEPVTVEQLKKLARYVDSRYPDTGELPALGGLFSVEPVALSRLTFVRGSIAVMNRYIFDTRDVFQVEEGIVGIFEDNQVFVFSYEDERKSSEIYAGATTRFSTGERFSDVVTQGDLCSMGDRDGNFIVIRKTGRHIVTVIGPNHEKIEPLVMQITRKLNGS
jgi:hypothetical protein